MRTKEKKPGFPVRPSRWLWQALQFSVKTSQCFSGFLSPCQKRGYSVYPRKPMGAIVAEIFMKSERALHFTPTALPGAVPEVGAGGVFKDNISLCLDPLGLIAPGREAISLLCFIDTLKGFQPKQHFVPCTSVPLPNILNYRVQGEANPQVRTAGTRMLRKGFAPNSSC